MSNRTIAVVLATVFALGLAGYAGWSLHRARTVEGERIRNALLAEERARIDTLFALAAAASQARKTRDSVTITRLLTRDSVSIRTSDGLRSTVAHLTAEARTVADSLRLIPVMESTIAKQGQTIDGLVASRDTAIVQRGRADEAAGRLRGSLATSFARFDSLARLRPSVPVVRDRKLLGLFIVKPCGFTGVSTTLRPTAGLGVCVSV